MFSSFWAFPREEARASCREGSAQPYRQRGVDARPCQELQCERQHDFEAFAMTDVDIVPPDMTLELQQFDKDAEQITKSLVGTIEASPPPPIIYHYTNDVGLRGILEAGRVWLTDIFSLNDPSELSHGFSHVVKILNDKAVTGPAESKLFEVDPIRGTKGRRN